MQNCFSLSSICHRSMFTHSLSLLQLVIILISIFTFLRCSRSFFFFFRFVITVILFLALIKLTWSRKAWVILANVLEVLLLPGWKAGEPLKDSPWISVPKSRIWSHFGECVHSPFLPCPWERLWSSRPFLSTIKRQGGKQGAFRLPLSVSLCITSGKWVTSNYMNSRMTDL